MVKGKFEEQVEAAEVISDDAAAIITLVKKMRFNRSFFYDESGWRQAAKYTEDVAMRIIALGQKIKKDAAKLVPK